MLRYSVTVLWTVYLDYNTTLFGVSVMNSLPRLQYYAIRCQCCEQSPSITILRYSVWVSWTVSLDYNTTLFGGIVVNSLPRLQYYAIRCQCCEQSASITILRYSVSVLWIVCLDYNTTLFGVSVVNSLPRLQHYAIRCQCCEQSAFRFRVDCKSGRRENISISMDFDGTRIKDFLRAIVHIHYSISFIKIVCEQHHLTKSLHCSE